MFNRGRKLYVYYVRSKHWPHFLVTVPGVKEERIANVVCTTERDENIKCILVNFSKPNVFSKAYLYIRTSLSIKHPIDRYVK